MKKLIAKISTVFLLAFGVIFGASVFNPSLSVYAEPTAEPAAEPATNQTNQTTPADQTPGTPDTEPTAENQPTPNPSNPENQEENPDDNPEGNETPSEEEVKNACEAQTGALSWLVCPGSGVIASAVDSLYSAITDFLTVAPLSMADDSPIYLVWQYARNITNIVFIILLLIVIYSQITGLGIKNYGIKRVLPRLIISVILVNLSFLICSIAVDASNIIGADLRGVFSSIEDQLISSGNAINPELAEYSLSSLLTTIIGGGAVAGVAIGVAGGAGYVFFMFLVVLMGALVAVVTGLLTIAARQALVALLIMIAPLAFVAYLLPNTEKWFGRWKDLLLKMLIFYPMFSFLFGASQLLGYALIMAANSEFGIILGVAVQIFPLIFSWSLMKMSGTILGTLNSGLRRIASPVQKGVNSWSMSQAEQQRSRYVANSMMPGARLRRYLDYRNSLRKLDTENNTKTRENRALERAYGTASSSTGRDVEGNATWRKRANRYTVSAKTSSLYNTKASVAKSAYENTLSAAGRTFDSDARISSLADAHGEAFKDAMAQQFLTVNEAQADQEWLLNQYLDAAKALDGNANAYEYNRLIKGAAGGLGHNGESSIMGQVITGNSAIENRRRSEARIIITKFGVKKPLFRGMVFDKQYINDNGYATDENGREIEDSQFRLKKGESYTPWQHYIGVHKTTGAEISREQYDGLSDAERANYRRVRYFDITDDAGNPVQRVFDDDAGYMKEMLGDDINIGDPINRRYLTEIGVSHAPTERTGMLRRYHSTITAAMLNSKYKDHAAEVTPMITAQANMGYITSIGQYNIANLQSLNVASKAGSYLQNDKYAIETWAALLSSINNPEDFAKYFPDDDIMNYRNVNGLGLKGLKLIEAVDKETGKTYPKWEDVGYEELTKYSDEEKLQLRKNYILHSILPKTAKKLIGMSNRNMSPNILENQKPDTLEALINLVNTLTKLGTDNADPNVSFTDKLDGNQDLYDSQDPNSLRHLIANAKDIIHRRSNPDAPTSTDGDTGKKDKQKPSSDNAALADILGRLARYLENQESVATSTDPTEVSQIISDHLTSGVTNFETFAESMRSYFSEIPGFRDDPGWQQIIDDAILNNPTTRDNFITNITNGPELSQARAEELGEALINYFNDHYSS